MVVTEIYNGQGLGNQLACYVTTRVLALDKGFDFGIMNPYKFKCLDFMKLDFGLEVTGGSSPFEGAPPITLPNGIVNYFREKDIRHLNGSDIRIDDCRLNLIEDNTKLDGVFQSETQIIHRKEEIKEWLKVNPEADCYDFSNENICVINFRGGEYAGIPNFYLNSNYWNNAVGRMLEINPNFEFVVITDDINRAKGVFPNFKVLHFNIGTDYSIIKNAHYLILSNSSFPYFATLTSETIKYILAPKYWGRHNISDGYWSCGYNIYQNYNYIDRDNNLFTFEECVNEFENYKKNTNLYAIN
jgi:hypothetical protein